MEEELLTLSDLIVKQELRNHEEDVHKFANITGSVLIIGKVICEG